MTKMCTECKTEKPVSEFSKRTQLGKSYLHSWCKECFKARKRGGYTRKTPQHDVPEGMRRCSRCEEVKSTEEFYTNGKAGGLVAACKECSRSVSNLRYDWETRRSQERFYRYGVSQEQYDLMLEAQGGVCKICECPETAQGGAGGVKPLAVDHDHACCGADKACASCVRGLLCMQCNQALGKFNDDVSLLTAAIAYLTAARADQSALPSTSQRAS